VIHASDTWPTHVVEKYRRAWARLYDVRARHPMLVVRAVTMLVRKHALGPIRFGMASQHLLADVWPAIEATFPERYRSGQHERHERFTPDEVTKIAQTYREYIYRKTAPLP